MMRRLPWILIAGLLGAACEQGGQSSAAAERGGTGAAAEAPASGQPGGSALVASGSGALAPANATAAASTPAARPRPQFKEVVIPAGTALNLTLGTPVGSDTSKVEDTVRAKVAKPIMVNGVAAVPAGAEVVGNVTAAERSGRVKGRASLALRFDKLTAWDETHEISTARISRQAEATKGKDATKVGVGAGAGALIGAIAGGGKGAAVGSAVGAGAGTGVVVATRGEEVRLAAGTVLRTTLQEPLTVRVPVQ